MPIAHGAHNNGLLCGYCFSADGIGQEIDLQAAVEWLKRPVNAGEPGFLWLHFGLTDASAQRWMKDNLALEPEFFEALGQGSRSTRIEDARDDLIAVINDVAYEFTFEPSDIETLWMSVSERVAVSARMHPLRSIDGLREAVRTGARFGSPVELLNHLMDKQGDVLVRIVREATLKVDSIEDSLLRGRLVHQRSDLGRLRRVLVRLQRLLAPEPGALFRLLRQPPPWIASADLDGLRQSTEEFSLVLRDLAALQERIKLLQEEIAAQVSEQTNRSLFTLTMVTVLALPINITTGFFGMNVGGVPLAEHAHGFLAVVLLVAIATGIGAWVVFRRKD
ncbi:transporter [Variovorax sp. YR752]|uniref:transporter n=1 Tax=Variovorax sp. YR752 TaxID=1884383 RepID=UPI0031377AB9